MKNVILIFGGTSSEHYVSINSAKSIYTNINKQLFNLTLLYISKNNKWYKFSGDFDDLLNNNWIDNNLETELFNIIKYLKSFDIVFPVLHGINGEDGRLQGLLELFNIPYVGNKVLASSLGINKIYSKILFKEAGIPTLPSVNIKADNYKVEDIFTKLDLPVIIKPNNGGSSIGINIAYKVDELPLYINIASEYDNDILIEPFIKAQELECAIIEDGDILASTVGEIKPARTFYDYEAKYDNKGTITLIPANISDDVANIIKEYSIKAFKALNCSNLARVDFFYDSLQKKIYLNEINTMPGFTKISMYPQLINSLNISYSNLITKLITNSLD